MTGLGLFLGGCTAPLSTLDPAGPAADAIAALWWIMLTGAAAIWALTMLLLGLAFRHRDRHDQQASKHETGLWLIGLGTLFPTAVLAALLAYGLVIGERLLPDSQADVVTVSAHAERWRWTFGYDDLRSAHTTTGLLHIPAGRAVDVKISTGDVIHSFWVPRLAGKLDAIPGRTQVLRIEASKPGVYAGRSSEFSGEGYLHHTFEVVAHDARGWQAFLESTPSDTGARQSAMGATR